MPTEWQKRNQKAVEILKQESSVEDFGVVHTEVMSGEEQKQTPRGASLRELQKFFKDQFNDAPNFAGLNRIGDPEDGTALWTTLTDPKEIEKALTIRTRQRQDEQLVSRLLAGPEAFAVAGELFSKEKTKDGKYEASVARRAGVAAKANDAGELRSLLESMQQQIQQQAAAQQQQAAAQLQIAKLQAGLTAQLTSLQQPSSASSEVAAVGGTSTDAVQASPGREASTARRAGPKRPFSAFRKRVKPQ